MGRWGDGEMGRWGDLTGVGFLHLGRESGIGSRESGVGNREKREMGRIIPETSVYFDTYFEEFLRSDAARSWGASAVLGVPPMSNWRGFPHSLLHQDNQSTYSPLCKKPTLMRMGRWGDGCDSLAINLVQKGLGGLAASQTEHHALFGT
ncbi:hypothetical protein [Moorena sp. SIO3E8]|nr:hypothetical protein [Moorena sp. SIO3E8]NEO17746.1 hypothetical protein [Moorena sp. SIO3E8]NEQ04294.1 hypothetical protein [Moorena sp. SIO3F7]